MPVDISPRINGSGQLTSVVGAAKACETRNCALMHEPISPPSYPPQSPCVSQGAPCGARWMMSRAHMASKVSESLYRCFFTPRIRVEEDHRTRRHRQAAGAFLQGRSTIPMTDIMPLIYDHPKSRPKKGDLE
jgi:hypothetical protein